MPTKTKTKTKTTTPPVEIPTSYTSHPYFTQIRIVHYPKPDGPPKIPIVYLNRPAKMNAFTTRMAEELVAAFNLFARDERVRCIVLTGTGPRAFCAGAELGEDVMKDPMPKEPGTHRDEGGQVTLSIHRCPKPTIAAIQSSAVGVGITMVLPCSIRIAQKSAKIAFAFVRRGLVPEAASSFFLPRLIGHSRAMHVLTTGETLPAGSKLLEGLFSEVLDAPPEGVLGRGIEIAEEIADRVSLVSAYLTKELVWRGPGTAEETHLLDSEIMFQLFSGVDKAEGVKSFLEKRRPEFRGLVPRDLPKNKVPWWEPVDILAPENEPKSKL